MSVGPKVLAEHDYRFAANHDIPMNDDRFFRDEDGIVRVDEQRWLAAQAVERYTWFELCRSFDDDRSREHVTLFDGYQALPTECGDVLEVGCGPFTQARTILQGRTLTSLTLLDPLLGEYLEHEHCSYRDGRLYGCPASLLALPAEKLPAGLRFDTIICINVLEHVRDAGVVLSCMQRALRAGGRLVLGETCHDDYHPSREFNLAHPLMLKRSFLEKATSGLRRLYFNDANQAFYLIGSTPVTPGSVE